jgi:hypothetical protein
MLHTVKILPINPGLQNVYLVIEKGFRIRSQVSGRTTLKLLEEEEIDLILCPPAVPLSTDEQAEALEQAAWALRHRGRRKR